MNPCYPQKIEISTELAYLQFDAAIPKSKLIHSRKLPQNLYWYVKCVTVFVSYLFRPSSSM